MKIESPKERAYHKAWRATINTLVMLTIYIVGLGLVQDLWDAYHMDLYRGTITGVLIIVGILVVVQFIWMISRWDAYCDVD